MENGSKEGDILEMMDRRRAEEYRLGEAHDKYQIYLVKLLKILKAKDYFKFSLFGFIISRRISENID